MKGLKKLILGLGLMIVSIIITQLNHIGDIIVSHIAHGRFNYGTMHSIMIFVFFVGIAFVVWGMIEKE